MWIIVLQDRIFLVETIQHWHIWNFRNLITYPDVIRKHSPFEIVFYTKCFLLLQFSCIQILFLGDRVNLVIIMYNSLYTRQAKLWTYCFTVFFFAIFCKCSSSDFVMLEKIWSAQDAAFRFIIYVCVAHITCFFSLSPFLRKKIFAK